MFYDKIQNVVWIDHGFMRILAQLLGLSALLVFPGNIDAQQWSWIHQMGNRAGGVAASLDGGIYSAAVAMFPTSPAPFLLPTASFNSIFIVKYDQSGSMVWVNEAHSDDYASVHGIAVDSHSNCFVTGSFRGNLNLPTTNLFGGGTYISKYDTSGNMLWISHFPGPYEINFGAVATGPNGNSFVTGRVEKGMTIANTSFTGDDYFLACVDINGQVLWAVSLAQAGGYGATIESLSTDSAGECYATGFNAEFSMFLTKYHAETGKVMWSKRVVSTGSIGANGMAVDASDAIYVTGFLRGIAQIGPTQLSSSTMAMFIAKYTSSGSPAWARQFVGTESAVGFRLASSPFGEIYVTGEFSQTLSVSTNSFSSPWGTDLVVIGLSPSGQPQWAQAAIPVEQKAAADNYLSISGIAVDRFGNAYISGTGLITVGTNTIKGGFLAKLSVDRPLVLLKSPSFNVDSSFQFDLVANPGSDCTVQISSDLKAWASFLRTNVADGTVRILVNRQSNVGPFFYRAFQD